MSFSNKQKSLCQMATTELYLKETKSNQTAREWQSSIWVWRLRLVVLGLSNHAEPFFLVWWSLTAQDKSSFSRFKWIKTQLKITMFQD